jgi:hypothetical protein
MCFFCALLGLARSKVVNLITCIRPLSRRRCDNGPYRPTERRKRKRRGPGGSGIISRCDVLLLCPSGASI